MHGLKKRIEKLEHAHGAGKRGVHCIMPNPGEDPDEVKRRYYAEHTINPGDVVIFLNLYGKPGAEQ
jgi:hypothetical protein